MLQDGFQSNLYRDTRGRAAQETATRCVQVTDVLQMSCNAISIG